jgi:uncharacterized ferritin-like protein (DUF455 family)
MHGPAHATDIIAVMELRRHALELLALSDPGAKARGTRVLLEHLRSGCRPDPDARLEEPARLPGRPARPLLVAPSRLARRSTFTVGGRAALLHALAHIEFNAINLALDAVWRFASLPEAYYLDWARVASEEAHHFDLLAAHLSSLGHAYGDFDAHDGLWAMSERTRHDVTARMALVPRTLEARGLDVTPALRARFAEAGDARAVQILDIILRDEIGHVAIGNRWYRWLCRRDGVDPIEHHELLAERHHAPAPRPPFNREARAAAGFTEAELQRLVR